LKRWRGYEESFIAKDIDRACRVDREKLFQAFDKKYFEDGVSRQGSYGLESQ